MEFDEAVAELETLVATLEREGDERALYLLELIDAVHRPGLGRLAAGDLEHPFARALLAMYDLAELEPEMLAEEALDEVRPYIESHGGAVDLLSVKDGVVEVELRGACVGCAGSAMTLQRGIETALRGGMPGFRELVAREPEGAPSPQLLQIEGVEHLRRPEFVAVEAGDLGSGEMTAVEADGIPLLLVNLDDEVYAFRNACPVDGMSLEGGRLSGAVIVCPWHNCAFDARTGRRADEEGGDGLTVVPVALDEGQLRVAVNVL